MLMVDTSKDCVMRIFNWLFLLPSPSEYSRYISYMKILGTYLHFTCLDSLKNVTKSKTLYAKLKPFSEPVSIEGGDCFFEL